MGTRLNLLICINYIDKVYAEPLMPETSHFKVFVDGINVGSIWLKRGESKYV